MKALKMYSEYMTINGEYNHTSTGELPFWKSWEKFLGIFGKSSEKGYFGIER
jgi:hypothetical protein